MCATSISEHTRARHNATQSGSGTVYLVGAGPGAPDLLTVRALRLLERADVVLYDALVHHETVALAVRAKKFAVGKRCGARSVTQADINRLTVDCARSHEVVVRLKGGDPMLFARVDDEIRAIRAAGLKCEIVPGITAALAAGAALGIPLTRRGSVRSVTLATPVHGDGTAGGDWARAAAAADAGAIYMGARRAAATATAMMAAGKARETPVAIVENISLSAQRIHFTTLAALRDGYRCEAAAPALMLFGPQFVDGLSRTIGAESRVRDAFAHASSTTPSAWPGVPYPRAIAVTARRARA